MAHKPPHDWKRDTIWQFIGVVVTAIGVIIAIIFGVPALTQANPPRQTPSPTQITNNGSIVTPTITITPTVVTTPSLTPTPQPAPTDTPTADPSTPAATFPPNPAPATQVKDALPLLLNCHCASNPLQIQVTDVHIDPANGHMTWKLALRNISTQVHQVQLSRLILRLDEQESPAEGGVMANSLTLNPNEVGYSTITFTFVPLQATYTLKLGVWLDSGFSFSSVSYDDSNGDGTNQITFQ